MQLQRDVNLWSLVHCNGQYVINRDAVYGNIINCNVLNYNQIWRFVLIWMKRNVVTYNTELCNTVVCYVCAVIPTTQYFMTHAARHCFTPNTVSSHFPSFVCILCSYTFYCSCLIKSVRTKTTPPPPTPKNNKLIFITSNVMEFHSLGCGIGEYYVNIAV